MTVLRSRDVPSFPAKPHSKTVNNSDAIEPATPARTKDSEAYSSPPNPEAAKLAPGSVSASRPTVRRRSLRLSPQSVPRECDGGMEQETETGIRVLGCGSRESGVLVKGIGASGEKGGSSRKRRLNDDEAFSQSFEDLASKGFLNLRSGKRVPKRRVENRGVDLESESKGDGSGNGNAVFGNLNCEPLVGNLDDNIMARRHVVEEGLTGERLEINGNGVHGDDFAVDDNLRGEAEAKNLDLKVEETVINKHKRKRIPKAVTSGNLDKDENTERVNNSVTVNSKQEFEPEVKSLVHGTKGTVENKRKGKQLLEDEGLLNETPETCGNGKPTRSLLEVIEKRVFESNDSNSDDNEDKRKRALKDQDPPKEKSVGRRDDRSVKKVFDLNKKLNFESENNDFEGKVVPARTDEGAISGKLESTSIGEARTTKGRRRFTKEEKGKGILIEDDRMLKSDEVEKSIGQEIKRPFHDTVEVATEAEKTVKLEGESKMEKKERENESRIDQFRDIARRNASRFALFEAWSNEDEDSEVEGNVVDWPGPFSTAMKIIRDREDRKTLHVDSSISNRVEPVQLMWVPKKDQVSHPPRRPPSLQDICIKVLARNVDALTSLECVPDALKHKLCHMLCESRRMDSHIFNLLLRGSPTEIRLQDCSWLTEEQFTECFKRCDTSNLLVLQLDQCGRCVPDYILLSTLASSSNSLPLLSSLSLSGACRLSDIGLRALVSSAPSLRSINLSQCSLLTSSSIGTLADALGPVLRELYINDCQGIDAMLILGALQKFENLEVLSLAGVQNVKDRFIREFVTARGYNMKELFLSDCGKLTDSSVKIIAENCPALHALDISNLTKLTDSALGFLANGCRVMQNLRLCRNTFSDEAIAAFLETAGDSLKELSLNNVKKVNHNTAVSIARRSRKLQSLDLSWCRNLTDEAVGLIVDSCSSLRVLKLFGCTQITNVFWDGHSNPNVQIIGLLMSSILDSIEGPDSLKAP